MATDNSDIGPVETLYHITRSDVLFRGIVICEETHSYCEIVFTNTHFAWAPFRSPIWMPIFLVFERFALHHYTAVLWSSVQDVELDVRPGDREKLIRVTWVNAAGQRNKLEMTRIMLFNDWIRAFRRAGFEPLDGTQLRLRAIPGLIYDYGAYMWILLLAICSFCLVRVSIAATVVFVCLLSILAPVMWLFATRMIRRWVPVGTVVRLGHSGGGKWDTTESELKRRRS
jgi:hypothetical protein